MSAPCHLSGREVGSWLPSPDAGPNPIDDAIFAHGRAMPPIRQHRLWPRPAVRRTVRASAIPAPLGLTPMRPRRQKARQTFFVDRAQVPQLLRSSVPLPAHLRSQQEKVSSQTPRLQHTSTATFPTMTSREVRAIQSSRNWRLFNKEATVVLPANRSPHSHLRTRPGSGEGNFEPAFPASVLPCPARTGRARIGV